MYICLCKGISDRHIKEVVSQGHCDFKQVRCKTGLGTQCGVCRKSVKQFLSQLEVDSMEHKNSAEV